MDNATSQLLEAMRVNVFVQAEGGEEAVYGLGGKESKVGLVNILPGLTRWSYLALNGLPNELVDVSLIVSPRPRDVD